MNDVLLINPPGYRGRPRRGPYELAALAAQLRDAQLRSELVDLQLEIGEGRMPFPSGFAEALSSVLQALPARMVLITFRTTAGPWALLIAREYRRRFPGAAIIAFAPRIEDRLRRFMRDEAVLDALCVSDPAGILLEAARSVQASGREGLRRVPGLVLTTPEGLVETEPGPEPTAWPLQPEPWISPDRTIAAIHVGRGCPDRCTFCAAHLRTGGRPRYQPPDRAVRDAAAAYARLEPGARSFVMLEAENLTSNPAWLDTFAAERERLDEDFRWGAYGRIDHLDAAMRHRLANAGCCFLFIGIETGSAALQKVLGKHIDLAEVLPRLSALHSAGIVTQCSFIFGIPGETDDDFERTARLMAEIVWAGGYVDWTPLRIEAGTAMERLTGGHPLELMPEHELSVDLTDAGYDPHNVHPEIGYRMYRLDLPALSAGDTAAATAWRTLLTRLPLTTYVLAEGLALPAFRWLRRDSSLPPKVEDLRRWVEGVAAAAAPQALAFVQALGSYEAGYVSEGAQRYNIDLVYADIRRDPRRIPAAFDFPWWRADTSAAADV
jgi:hypothetical protein